MGNRSAIMRWGRGALRGQTMVFLITMRGHFTARYASGPPGATAPAGRYLSLVIDATTFRGLDFGIGPHPPRAGKICDRSSSQLRQAVAT
jgi:hypothetical protein